MMKDFHNNLLVKRAISPISVPNNIALISQIIDTKAFGALEFVIAAGNLADADVTFTILVEEGDVDNLSDATDVTDTNLIGTEAEAGFQFDDDNQVRKIGVLATKRYVRLTITPAANTSAALISAVALLGDPTYAPVIQTDS